ncbi:hypothetical protein P170DRAFT_505577 [Aspergillus steynii IBT 23096]|uniref:Uncharacterized protein n=1 Tax=Aspergillus steynii IBT 23096 TaxID=1392250 RepID=A0A2I2GPY4_9EURO|nr:uncharacterized protein P170DRAFT_505577 [Aspergillus steynii IBT 23096]PLB54936.1 hypothetical protein P170DRAFT_505577 [Aspergillus steynii IBT 23096]
MSPVESETHNMLLLQIAAESEVTTIARLGTVVIQFARHELLFNAADQEHVELLFDESDPGSDPGCDVLDSQPTRRRSGCQLDGLRDKLLRHPATWPNTRFEVLLTTSEDEISASMSTERLMPQVSMESRKTTDVVQLDHSYG